jgi:hypothetical protein
MSMMKKTALPLMLLCLLCAGCATTGGGTEEPTVTEAAPAAEVAEAIEEAAPPADDSSKQEEGEVAIPVAESEQPTQPTETVIVKATRRRTNPAARRRAPVFLHREGKEPGSARSSGGLRPVE